MKAIDLSPCVLTLALSSVTSAGLEAQVKWTRLAPSPRPSARLGHRAVSENGRALLFGGIHVQSNNRHVYFNGTWIWDGRGWRQRKVFGPSGRAGQAMAYDPRRKRVVLFSGFSVFQGYIPDTWEWDGSKWTRMRPATQPAPRDYAGMAYDPITGKVILFGGHDYRRSRTGTSAFGDTWAWDGKNWTKLAPVRRPSPRFGHGMVQRGTNGLILLFGGIGGKNDWDFNDLHNDLWIWVGRTWVRVSAKLGPPPRVAASVVYDEARARLVVYGGSNKKVAYDDTWEWDGNSWLRRLAGNGPGGTAGLRFPAAFYDPLTRRTILHGGAGIGGQTNPTDRTWSLSAVRAASVAHYGKACKSSAGTLALTATLPWLATRTRLALDAVPKTAVALFSFGASKARWGNLVLPLDLSPFGAPGCNLLAAPAFFVAARATNNAAEHVFTVPDIGSLVGVSLFTQGVVFDAHANALGVATSGGVELVFGSK